jgi:hypothetical protein
MFINQDVLSGIQVHFYDINSGTLFLKDGKKVKPPLENSKKEQHFLTVIKVWAISKDHIQTDDIIMLS